MAKIVGDTSGTENTLVSVSGEDLDLLAVSDDFTNGIDAGKWDEIVESSGTLTPLIAGLQLSTGIDAASSAILREDDAYENVDAEVELSLVYTDGVGSAWLGLTHSTGNLRASLHSNGTFSVTSSHGLTYSRPSRDVSKVRLRLLKYGSTVYVFVGDLLLLTTPWLSAAVKVEISVENNPDQDSYFIAQAAYYKRRPLIIFDTSPALTMTYQSANRVEVTAPNHPSGEVSLSVITDLTTIEVDNTFTYENSIDFRNVNSKLRVVSDVQLRNGRN